MAIEGRHLITGSTFDDIYQDLLWTVNNNPQHVCSPRGSKIKENLAVTLVLSNPRARLLSCVKRNTNYGFAVGEFLWYWNGKRDLETMLYYNKRMKDYSDDGETLNSAYGYRLKVENAQFINPKGQWSTAIHTLVKDPDSRRAVLHINRASDQLVADIEGSSDVPCTLSLQFFIRDNRLDLHVHMRSNDIMWGLTYDLFSFTLFQECMLLELKEWEKFKDLKLGKYYHTAGSLHIYEKHFDQASEICMEYGLGVDYKQPQEPLVSLEDLDKVSDVEKVLRLKQGPLFVSGSIEGTELWMIDELKHHRAKRDLEALNKKE